MKPEDGLFLKTDGTWSDVREEAKEFPGALSAREFLERQNISNAEIRTSGGVVSKRPLKRPPKKELRVRLICDGKGKGAETVSLSCVPVPGQSFCDRHGKRWNVTAMVTVSDEESNVTLYLRTPPPRAAETGEV